MTKYRSKFHELDEHINGHARLGMVRPTLFYKKGCFHLIVKMVTKDYKRVYFIPSRKNNITSLGKITQEGVGS